MIRSSLIAAITLIGLVNVSPVLAGGNSRGRTVVVVRHRPLATGVAPIGYTQLRPVRQVYTNSHSSAQGRPMVGGNRRTVRYYPAGYPMSYSMARARAAAGYGYGYRPQYYANTPYFGNYGYGVSGYSHGYGRAANTPYFGNNGYGIPGYSQGYGNATRGGACSNNGYVGGLHNIQSSVIQIPRGSCEGSR